MRRVAFGAIGAAELLRARAREPTAAPCLAGGLAGDGPEAHGPHAGDLRAFALILDEPLDWDAFAVWLTMLVHSHGLELLRVKGLLDVGEAGPVVLDSVQHVVHRPRHLLAWPDTDHRSRIVFITRGLERDAVLASLEAFTGLGRGGAAART